MRKYPQYNVKQRQYCISLLHSLLLPLSTLGFNGKSKNLNGLVGGNYDIGSLEIRASSYISAKLKKRTYTHASLQLPGEMNTRGSKTPIIFIPFHNKYDL